MSLKKRLMSIGLSVVLTAALLPTALHDTLTASAQAESEFVSSTIDSYNVTWNSQSANAGASMPVGGHSVGLNVWVENNDLLFYVGKSDAFDENGQLMKLGRVRVRMTPNPFSESTLFSQTLKLKEGYCEIKAQNAENNASINVWAEVDNPIVHVDLDAENPVKVEAFYESWRTADRVQDTSGSNNTPGSVVSYWGYPGTMTTYADTIGFRDNGVEFYHRNKDDALLFDLLVEQQGLESIKDNMRNVQKGYTFGGYMSGTGMVAADASTTGRYANADYTAWKIETSAPVTNTSIKIYTNTAQTETIDEWRTQLNAKKVASDNNPNVWDEAKAWWKAFWERSYITINTEDADAADKGWQVGRNYNLFRYMLGCNAKGTYPTKFNGGMFTFDPTYVNGSTSDTPDFRYWGGGDMTAQNQCRVNWPMIKSGDFDLLTPEFNFYDDSLENVKMATNVFWGHDGCAFNEYPSLMGISAGGVYGWVGAAHRTRSESEEYGVVANAYTKYQYNHQLEFSKMILEAQKYSGEDISRYIDFIESSLTFYNEHYKMRHRESAGTDYDENGKLVISPSTALETFKNVTNPTDVVAALISVIDELVALPASYNIDTAKWLDMKSHLPALTFGTSGGNKVLVPAATVGSAMNVEIPELYPVYPYNLYGVGKSDLDVAVNTWKAAPSSRKGYTSWHQDGIWTARLGLRDEAQSINTQKLQDGKLRFPAFWGPGHDWTPDHNWGSSGMNGLQEMMLQTTDDDMIAIAPAWNGEWDASFKLYAPDETIVEGTVKEGKAESVKVTLAPSSARDKVKLIYPNAATATVTDNSGSSVEYSVDAYDTITFDAAAGESYTITTLSQFVNVGTKYTVTKDTYIHPTAAATAKDGGPATTLIPNNNAATCKGDSPFMMSGAKSSPTGYLGVRTDGVTYGGGTSDVGSCRNALVQYTLPEGIDPQSIGKATVNFTVNDLSATPNSSQWRIPSLYEVSTDDSKCTSWDEMTVKGTDIGDKGEFIALGTQKLTHPIYNISGGVALPMDFDITDYLKAELTEDPTKTEFAFRIAMPTDMVFLFTKEYNNGQYASYIEIKKGANVSVTYQDAEGNTLASKTISCEIGEEVSPNAPLVFNVNGKEYMYNEALSTASVIATEDGNNTLTFVYEEGSDYTVGSIINLEGKRYRILSENIFTNPGFEENSDTWTKRGAALSWTRDATRPYEGLYSILGGNGAICCRMATGTTEVGKTYFFSTNVYTEKENEGAWYHVSHDLQSSGSSTDYYGGAYNAEGTFVLPAGEWQQQEYTFTVPEGSDGSFIFDANWTSGAFRYDNFKLYEVEDLTTTLTFIDNTVKVKNLEGSATLYIAYYDGNKLISAEKSDISADTEKTIALQGGATSARAMLWNSNNTLQPVCVFADRVATQE